MPRIRLLSDGSLQIVNLNRSDSGIYICTADNGLTHPLQKEWQLRIIGKFPRMKIDYLLTGIYPSGK